MRLVILAATLPAYRKDFYESLNIRLKERGCDMIVIHGTSFFNKSIKFDENPGYTAIPIKTVQVNLLGYDVVWWRKILQTIRKINPQIIIFHAGSGNISLWIIQLYCYLTKVKVGLWGCGYTRQEIQGIRRKLRGKIRSLFLNRASFIITYGTKLKNELLQQGVEESKIFVAQNTINIEKILNQNISRNLDSLKNEIVFLFVGALIPQKNLELAIKAIALLVREKHNIKFNIVGKGGIIDELRTLVNIEGMNNNIFILGPKYKEELSSYFIHADVFLLSGTGGLAVNEAMAYELPIITTIGDGTIIDLVYEGQNGFFLDDKPSIKNLYEICKKILELSNSQILEMGILSKQIISKKATLQNMVSSFESAIFK